MRFEVLTFEAERNNVIEGFEMSIKHTQSLWSSGQGRGVRFNTEEYAGSSSAADHLTEVYQSFSQLHKPNLKMVPQLKFWTLFCWIKTLINFASFQCFLKFANIVVLLRIRIM